LSFSDLSRLLVLERNYFCCPLAFRGPLAPRFNSPIMPTCGCCRKRAGEARCQQAPHGVQISRNVKKGTKVNRGERRGGQFCQSRCGSLYFLKCMSSYNRHWADCLDESRPPPPTRKGDSRVLSPIIVNCHPGGASEKRGGESEGRRIPITICTSSEPWTKAVICAPRTRHRCLVI
jgi:hypothetical protein